MIQFKKIVSSQKFYSTFGSVLNAGFGLVSFAVLARALSKEEFGVWTVFLTVYGLLEMLRTGMVGHPLGKMISEGNETYYKDLLASAFRLCLRFTFISIFIVATASIIVSYIIDDNTYILYSFWFSFIYLVSIPANFGVWVNIAKINFRRVGLINVFRSFFFLVGTAIVFLADLGVPEVMASYGIAALLISFVAYFMKWTSLHNIRKATARYIKKISDFGRYGMGTMLGGSILTSSDTFVILFFLGPEAVAIYNVPMRVINLYDIPLRSIVQLAYPSLAKVQNEHGTRTFRKKLDASNGFTFLLMLPLSILIFIFAEQIIYLIAGAEYLEATSLLRVFCVFLVITPLDRFAGIALDVLNRPNLNFKKMMWMVVINIIGDLGAVLLGGGIFYVAVTSIFTYGLGAFIGYYLLRQMAPFRFFVILKEGLNEIRLTLKQLRIYPR